MPASRRVETPFHQRECSLCLAHARGISVKEAERLISADRARAFVELYPRYMGEGDPLAGLKDELNSRVSLLAQDLRPSSLEEALAVMASANGVDWGLRGYTYSLEDLVSPQDARWIPGRKHVLDAVQHAATIAIALDNAGEAVIDLIVASWLQEKGYKVTLIARSLPHEIDITYQELQRLQAALGTRLEAVETGGRYPVFHPESWKSQAWSLVENADLVLSKGISNYEAATENPSPALEKTVFLLRAKCNPISWLHQVPRNTPIIHGGLLKTRS